MLKIVLIEDDFLQRKTLVEFLNRYIAFEQIDAIVSFDTGNVAEMLAHVREDPQADYFFIVDIDLSPEQGLGVGIAEKIRQYYPYASIVFLASHTEQTLNVLIRHIMPLDYIIKNDEVEEILGPLRKDILYALSRLEHSNKINPDIFTFKINNRYYRITTADILFFESVSNQVNTVILHSKDQKIEIKKSLKILERQNLPNFFRCHKSYLINLGNVYEFDKKNGRVFFDRQRMVGCQVSHRKARELSKVLKNYT